VTDQPLVKVQDLSVQFVSRDATVHAVNGVSFTLERGEVLGILGESGSGKSVTLRALMRLLPARKTRLSGRVEIAGADVMALDQNALARLRGPTVAMIFQEHVICPPPVTLETHGAYEHVTRCHYPDRGGSATAMSS
jgi:peptide/nickel transport system ATP-binding protein